ncbi:hypothetical protein ABZX97_10090 [Streptomyces seoulensis]|uniref:hypothetical protein n=1 Tax=Streptomyces seoulensis TaxID=73044 RepID=UPI0033A162ED
MNNPLAMVAVVWGALAWGGRRCVVTLHTDGSVSVKGDGRELQLAEQPLLSGLIPKATF